MKRFMLLVSICLLNGCARYDIQTESMRADLGHKINKYDQVERGGEQTLTVREMSINKLNDIIPNGGGSSQGNAPKGYIGIVKNFSEHEMYNFVIRGIDVPTETKSFLLPAGMSAETYLLPGKYTCTVYRGSRIEGNPWKFSVGLQVHEFLGKKYHWYVY